MERVGLMTTLTYASPNFTAEVAEPDPDPEASEEVLADEQPEGEAPAEDEPDAPVDAGSDEPEEE